MTMVFSLRWTLVSLLVAGGLIVETGSAAAQVRDPAGYFKPETVQKANQVIQDIKKRYRHDLLVETFKTVPEDQAAKVREMSREDRNRFFNNWARQRAREAAVNGVFILLCQNPPHIQVEVGDKTRQRAFTLEDRDRLSKILVSNFQQKRFDEGLLQAVRFVQETMGTNLQEKAGSQEEVPVAPPADQTPIPGRKGGSLLGGWLCGLVCLGLVVLAVIWVIIGLFRTFARGRRGGYPDRGGSGGGPGPGYGGGYAPGYGGGAAPGYGGGGGGFLSSLFGGMFGAAAGNWIYDRFRGGPSQSSWGGAPPLATPPASGPNTALPDSGRDQDYSGTGADYGDVSGGGGDTGGGGDYGDTGGGDTGGGGDYGGGGDFGGGGDVGGGGDYGGGGDFGGGGDTGGGGDY